MKIKKFDPLKWYREYYHTSRGNAIIKKSKKKYAESKKGRETIKKAKARFRKKNPYYHSQYSKAWRERKNEKANK